MTVTLSPGARVVNATTARVGTVVYATTAGVIVAVEWDDGNYSLLSRTDLTIIGRTP